MDAFYPSLIAEHIRIPQEAQNNFQLLMSKTFLPRESSLKILTIDPNLCPQLLLITNVPFFPTNPQKIRFQ